MPRFCAHLGYLFTELPLAERFQAARAAGFHAVEHPNPHAFGVNRFRDAAAAAGLAVAQISAPSGDAENGEKGFACLNERTDDFRASVAVGIKAAVEIGAPMLHVMPGVLPDGMTRAQCRATYLGNMAWAADQCAEADVTMLIEPISDESVAGFYVNHPDFAAELLGQLDHPRARMMFDVYHAGVKGLDPLAFIAAHLPLIAHMQIADHPGRHEPGTGTLPFARLFPLLDELGYAGWVGCEYKPRAGTTDGLDWLRHAEAPEGHKKGA